MKKIWKVIQNTVVVLTLIVALGMMVFTLISVKTFNQNDRSIFGYKAFIVMSDSMSATDFDAGDLVLLKDVDPASLKEGDIIAFTSRNAGSYGETVTHKIRSLTVDAYGNPGFITYGTTTGTDDEKIVPYEDIVGKYQSRLPSVGKFFYFLKSTPGYILLILVPFLLLLIFQGIGCVHSYREFRAEEMDALCKERDRIQSEIEASERRLKELQDKLKEE